MRDINVRGILYFAGALLAAAIVIHVGLWWLLQVWSGASLVPRPQVPPAVVTPPAAPGPGVRAAPPIDLEQLRSQEMQRLTTYGWVDEEAGTVRIPIDQAMQMLVEQGRPARDREPPAAPLAPAYRMDGSGGLQPAGE
jgi:hypothetical protein